jgi:hypothetical protein
MHVLADPVTFSNRIEKRMATASEKNEPDHRRQLRAVFWHVHVHPREDFLSEASQPMVAAAKKSLLPARGAPIPSQPPSWFSGLTKQLSPPSTAVPARKSIDLSPLPAVLAAPPASAPLAAPVADAPGSPTTAAPPL